MLHILIILVQPQKLKNLDFMEKVIEDTLGTKFRLGWLLAVLNGIVVANFSYYIQRFSSIISWNINQSLYDTDINFDITKKSKRLGRYVQFEDQEGIVLEEMKHNADLASQYITRRASDRSIQCSSLSFISYVSYLSIPLDYNYN